MHCRLSSVVEHFHGKEGVSGSNPEDGSIRVLNVHMLKLVCGHFVHGVQK